MRKLIPLIFLVANFANAFSQAPQAVTYQAVATNASGLELISSPIGVRASVVQGLINNPAQYIETFAVTTDTFGLFTINIGQGAYSGGTLSNFSQVNWGAGPFFLKIEMDATGGTSYSFMGANQILSVPYALYSLKSDTANYVINNISHNDADTDSTNELQTLSLNGDTLSISNGNSVILHDSIGSPYTPPINQPISISYLGGIIDVSPIDNADSTVSWGPVTPAVPGAHNIDDGLGNTQAIVTALGNNGGTAYAAKVCDTLNAYGFSDWYLPSVRELMAMAKQAYLIPSFSTFFNVQRNWWSSNEDNNTSSKAWTWYSSEGQNPEGFIGASKTGSGLMRTRCIRHH